MIRPRLIAALVVRCRPADRDACAAGLVWTLWRRRSVRPAAVW